MDSGWVMGINVLKYRLSAHGDPLIRLYNMI